MNFEKRRIKFINRTTRFPLRKDHILNYFINGSIKQKEKHFNFLISLIIDMGAINLSINRSSDN